MPRIGVSDDFEANYMADLKARVIRHGTLVEYPRDRATLDLGLHLKYWDGEKIDVTQVRVWMQAKGLRSMTLSSQEWDASENIPVSGLVVDHVKFWYGSPEPVYLVVYVESANTFLAADIRDLVDHLGGMPYLTGLGQQNKMALRVPKSATLEAALIRMPSHRSMRIDGPAFRGRPLGHHYDPLRSELLPLLQADYIELVDDLLDAHEFRVDHDVSLAGDMRARLGKLYLTYEWVLPMTTEFGYDEDSDFRIEGEPNSAHGDILVLLDPSCYGPSQIEAELKSLVEQSLDRGASKALVFINSPESDLFKTFAAWRIALEPLVCLPQAMGSLTFNILTTTNLYIDAAPKLAYRFINYLN